MALSGVVTVPSGSQDVIGTSTLFSEQLNPGDAIQIEGEVFSVLSITNDTTMQIDTQHSKGALGVTAYTDGMQLRLRNGANLDKLVVDKSGFLIRSIAHASENGPSDNTNNGFVSKRILNFDKARNDSEVRIGYTDNFRVSNLDKACRWEIMVDGSSCPGQALIYDFNSGGSATIPVNMHRSQHLVGYCKGLSAGRHKIQIWVNGVPGYLDYNCNTGWFNSTWVLEAEEVN